jgi:hypothetical protein
MPEQKSSNPTTADPAFLSGLYTSAQLERIKRVLLSASPEIHLGDALTQLAAIVSVLRFSIPPDLINPKVQNAETVRVAKRLAIQARTLEQALEDLSRSWEIALDANIRDDFCEDLSLRLGKLALFCEGVITQGSLGKPGRGRPPRNAVPDAVAELARLWKHHTGTTPSRDSDRDSGRPAGRFSEFVYAVIDPFPKNLANSGSFDRAIRAAVGSK